jgi:hypothetical protein
MSQKKNSSSIALVKNSGIIVVLYSYFSVKITSNQWLNYHVVVHNDYCE